MLQQQVVVLVVRCLRWVQVLLVLVRRAGHLSVVLVVVVFHLKSSKFRHS